jgi:hypothetical protein
VRAGGARMNTPDTSVRTFDVEGQEVRCYLSDGDRLWHCECESFQRTLPQDGEGFCPHTAVAIMRALEDGSLAR